MSNGSFDLTEIICPGYYSRPPAVAFNGHDVGLEESDILADSNGEGENEKGKTCDITTSKDSRSGLTIT